MNHRHIASLAIIALVVFLAGCATTAGSVVHTTGSVRIGNKRFGNTNCEWDSTTMQDNSGRRVEEHRFTLNSDSTGYYPMQTVNLCPQGTGGPMVGHPAVPVPVQVQGFVPYYRSTSEEEPPPVGAVSVPYQASGAASSRNAPPQGSPAGEDATARALALKALRGVNQLHCDEEKKKGRVPPECQESKK